MTTITLEVDDKLFNCVQNYARSQQTSLDLLIENYFQLLAQQNSQPIKKKLFPLSTIEKGFGCVNYQGKVISLEEMEQGISGTCSLIKQDT